MSIMLSSRLNSITGPLDTTGLRQSGLLELRRAEIGDGEIEPPLRLQKGDMRCSIASHDVVGAGRGDPRHLRRRGRLGSTPIGPNLGCRLSPQPTQIAGRFRLRNDFFSPSRLATY